MRASLADAIVDAMSSGTHPTVFEIVLHAADPPSGHVRVVSGATPGTAVTFVGWLGLLEALDGVTPAWRAQKMRHVADAGLPASSAYSPHRAAEPAAWGDDAWNSETE